MHVQNDGEAVVAESIDVTAEPIASGWLLQCVEYPGAMSQVKDLTDPFIIREAIAFVSGWAEATFLIDFAAKSCTPTGEASGGSAP